VLADQLPHPRFVDSVGFCQLVSFLLHFSVVMPGVFLVMAIPAMVECEVQHAVPPPPGSVVECSAPLQGFRHL